jgi:hypothetical protein
MKGWRPDIDLERLLAALGAEILAATDEEVDRTCAASGRSPARVATQVRNTIATALGGGEQPDAGQPLPDAVRRREACSRHH